MNPEALLAHDAFVRSLARSLVFGSEDVDDVVQETFVAALRRPPREGPSVRGYLATIVRNVLRQMRRGDGRRRAREARAALTGVVPSEALIREREEERRRVVDAVFHLDPVFRDAVLLRYFESLPPRRIAERLDVPVETVKSRLKRAHAKLRDRLDDGHDGDRKAWAILLLPLAEQAMGAAAPVALATPATAALAGAVLIALGAATWLSLRPEVNPEPPRPAGLPAEVALVSGQAEDAPSGNAFIEGEVLRDGERVPARVEVALLLEGASMSPGSGLAAYDELFREPGEEPLRIVAASGGEGEFRAEGLSPGTWEVRAVAADGARGTAAAIIPAGAESVEATVEIVPTRHLLRGRAVLADGQPFRGRVGVLRKMMPLGWPGGVTDEDGRFVLADLAPGPLRLTALLTPDVRVWGPAVTVPREDEVLFVVDAGSAVVPGRAVDDRTGFGVAGARIVASGKAFFSRATSGRDGSFRIAVPLEGGEVLAEARGYGPWRNSLAANSKSLELRLDPRAGISGRVTSDIDDRPVSGAVVRWSSSEHFLNQEGGETTSDQNGRYTFTGVAPGTVRLRVQGGGWLSRELLVARGSFSIGSGEKFDVEIPAGGAVQQDLVAVKAGAVDGRVLGVDGMAVEGVTVVLKEDPMRSGMSMMDFGRRDPAPETRTDSEGRFEFRDLSPGAPLTFLARPEGGAPARSEQVVLTVGERRQIEIRLAPARTLEITVVEAGSGSAVPDARVTIRPFEARMTGGFQLDYRTGRDGRTVAKPVPEGRLRVSADHEGHLRMRRVYFVDPGERQLRIEMEPGHSLSGRLTWPDGSPAAKLFVSARATYPGKKYNVEENAQTDRNGEFTIERLPAGSIDLSAVAERDGQSFRVKAKAEAGESSVSLVLAEYVDPAGKRKLRIRILDSAGQPVSRAWGVFYHRTDDGRGSGGGLEKARDGSMSVDLPRQPFTGWLEIFRAEDAKRRPLPLGAVFFGPIRPGEDDFEVRLPPERTIEGRVVDESGKGVSGATVSARPAKGDGPGRPEHEYHLHASAKTGPDGRFRLGRLGDRQYRVTVLPPHAFARARPADVPAGATALRIELHPSANPVLTVLDPEGRPVSGAVVRVSAPHAPDQLDDPFDEHRIAGGTTDAAGVVRLRGLDPRERYRLEIYFHLGRSDLRGAVRHDWLPNEETITLSRR